MHSYAADDTRHTDVRSIVRAPAVAATSGVVSDVEAIDFLVQEAVARLHRRVFINEVETLSELASLLEVGSVDDLGKHINFLAPEHTDYSSRVCKAFWEEYSVARDLAATLPPDWDHSLIPEPMQLLFAAKVFKRTTRAQRCMPSYPKSSKSVFCC